MRHQSTVQLAALLLTLIALLGSPAWAGDTATQTLTYSVQPVSQISVSGSPASMRVTAAAPGAAPVPAIDNSTRYAMTSNAGAESKKITAALDTDLPTGVTLEVELSHPGGHAISTPQILSATPADVVTQIGSLSVADKPIIYRLSAGPEAGVVSDQSVTVIYTITSQI